ncbi:chemotaxis protein MotB [Natronocella acetinitrilica]|uniref:Chemotaxis protein MotB n=1 Tax=Natronocella acetinitrilica TaxID=414046 RepID=A0AAE3G362_9GAMM|nr:flagellar motor protein MotB [Natronocella acetinitrilica]MCP1674956.1 chemotaxis protein MotB [Natronocella acetinitrilica]
MEDRIQPIIVKRIKKVKGGHHGGSWKVAFADFMTAMFAMFLVLWLVTAMDEPQRQAVAEYFRNPTMVEGADGAGPPSLIDFEGGSEVPIDLGEIPVRPDDASILEEARRLQAERLESLQVELERAIEQSQALEPFKDQLLLDITPEGLRIQLVDRRNRPMFDLGSAELRDYAARILNELGVVINAVPNKVAITGHTDAIAFAGPRAQDYDNWELSADRANAARRALLSGGIEPQRIAQVVGLADRVLFDRENPTNPINRRISITVLNEEAERAITEREGSLEFQGSD